MKTGERLLSIPEVHELVLKEQASRELTYEQKLVLQHCEMLLRFDLVTAQKLIAELEAIERVSGPLAHKIAELGPDHPDDVRAIFSKERFTLDEKKIKAIIETVQKYNDGGSRPETTG
jgi:DNA-directed RNA polymerase subunit F